MENLENVIESILFVAGEPVLISDICYKLEVDQKEIEEAVETLKMKYSEKSGIQLLCFNNKLQLSSNPNYVDFVSAILNPIRQRNLTKATLETIAIIAYKQPVTRLDIEDVRGVNSDYAINILLEHKLIEIIGHKDAVGKPALFATTDEFLKRFGISSTKELPDYNKLMEDIEKIRENYSDSLFNRFEPVIQNQEDLDKKLNEISKQETEEDEEL